MFLIYIFGCSIWHWERFLALFMALYFSPCCILLNEAFFFLLTLGLLGIDFWFKYHHFRTVMLSLIIVNVMFLCCFLVCLDKLLVYWSDEGVGHRGLWIGGESHTSCYRRRRGSQKRRRMDISVLQRCKPNVRITTLLCFVQLHTFFFFF